MMILTDQLSNIVDIFALQDCAEIGIDFSDQARTVDRYACIQLYHVGPASNHFERSRRAVDTTTTDNKQTSAAGQGSIGCHHDLQLFEC